MPDYSNQYRPLPDTLTAEADPLCTAYYKLSRENANVLKGRTVARKVLEMAQFPQVGLPVGFAVAPTAETYVCQAQIPARLGHTDYSVRLWCRDHAAGPGAKIRIRTDRQPYVGSGALGAFDTTALTANADSLTLALNGTGVYAWYGGTVGIVPVGVSTPFCWAIVTVQIDAGGSATDFGMLFMEYEALS